MKKLIFFLLFYFEISPYVCFVLHAQGRVYARQNIAGFFYARDSTIYGSVPPCGASMRPLPLRCKTTGKAEPFFISAHKQKILKMSYTEKNCLNGNNSTTQATPEGGDTLFFVHLLSAVQRQVQLETNIKNNLYAFILERGLYRELKEYSSAHDMSSPGGHARALVSVSFSSLQKSKNMEVCHE